MPLSKNFRSRPVFKSGAIDDQEKFKPLPEPTGLYPYHLDLEKIIPGLSDEKIVFQVCGDTGGIVLPTFQHQVVREMTKQFHSAQTEQDRPKFFFHLGDVVYNFGQQHEYLPQFFEPFKNYPAPVFAIAGNHDGDVDPHDPNQPKSLDAFVKVFCDTEYSEIPFAADTGYKTNIQPNIYFNLETPLANVIGLYSNVPRFGTITSIQREWFIEELKSNAKKRNEKALILCLHHSAYSADINHGSSLAMQLFLRSAFEEAGVLPDLVLSGHVHNYQRFSKKYSCGKIVPFVVAGAGGYAQLHAIAPLCHPDFPDNSNLLDDVCLERYCDNNHGFLKIAIQKKNNELSIHGEYYTIPQNDDNNQQAMLYDSFAIKVGDK